jgi:Trypsin
MLRRFGSLAFGLVAAALVGCSGPTPGGEHVRETTQPIVNGSSDATSADDAMVGVIWEGSNELTECTGTVIAINGQDIYVLTAAHCCASSTPPQFITRGPRYDQPTAVYSVLQYLANPQYTMGMASSPFDFCMVTAGLGGQAAPPVIPAMTPTTDNVTASTSIIQVGYGQTVAGPEGSDNNVFRNQFGPVNVQQFYQYQITYDETAGGTCFGDSGGPDLAVGSDGQREVFGVHSFVEGNCNMLSGSGRVSTVYNSFIVPYLNGTPPTEDCNQCQAAAESGACGAQDQTCGMNSECVAFANCLQGCGGGASCVQSCSSQHPNGVADYNALVSCICDTACPTICASVCGSSSVSSTGALMLTSSSSSGSGSTGGGSPGAGGSNAGGGKGNAGGGGTNSDTPGNDGGCAWSGSPRDGAATAALGLLAALSLLRRRRAR